MKIIIKNSHIIAPGFNEQTKFHLLVDDGKIIKISEQYIASGEDTLEIEGEGAYISPGWCDLRANFCDPGLEHKEDLESGAKAAADGGFTSVAVLPNTQPALDSKEGIKYIRGGNRDRISQLYPLGAVTVGTKGVDLAEMMDLWHAGALAFTDGTHSITSSGIILKTLQYLQQFNGLLINHPTEASLVRGGQMHEGINSTMLGMQGMPSLAEEMAIARDLRLLQYAGGRLHFGGVSAAASVALIRQAKSEGLAVSCDVAVAQLLFTDNDLLDFDTNYKVNPPLRSEADRQALITGVKDGTIDAIVSDHQPQDTESKKLEFDLADFGMISLQTLFPSLVGIKEFDYPLLIEKIAVAPRKLLGLPEIRIEEGAMADFTLFSPTHAWKFSEDRNFSKAVNSPFLGQKLVGKAVGVVANGQYMFDDSVTVKANG